MAIIDSLWWVWLVGFVSALGVAFYSLRYAMSDGLGRLLIFGSNLAAICFGLVFLISVVIKVIRYSTSGA